MKRWLRNGLKIGGNFEKMVTGCVLDGFSLHFAYVLAFFPHGTQKSIIPSSALFQKIKQKNYSFLKNFIGSMSYLYNSTQSPDCAFSIDLFDFVEDLRIAIVKSYASQSITISTELYCIISIAKSNKLSAHYNMKR